MIEEIILNYLNNLKQVPAYMEKEPNMPEEYFLIEKTGGSEENYIKQATIAIKSCSASLYKAAVLNEKLKETMKKIIKLDEVSKCSLNSDYPYSDTSRKEYRYQAVFDITYF